ncbi:MAG: Fe-S protein assembly co-chaperone HscB [Rickettsiaceae bacterium]
MNHFELFAIKQKYDIDQKLLQKQYFALQTKHHPDRSKNELDRRKNLEYSMLINEAFKVLQDDYLRAEYLLNIKGKHIDDNKLKSLLSHNQLEEILENYELIESTQDLSQLNKIQQDKIGDCQKLVCKITQAFTENNLKQALDLTVSLKYLTNLVGNIKLKIKNANN